MKFNGGKILLAVIGLAFAIYALMLVVLMVAGTPTKATITSYRRSAGERNETIPNQYTYVFSYEFEVDGSKYTGNGQEVKPPIHVKNAGGSTISIRYLPGWPAINSPMEAELPLMSTAIFLTIGIGLLYVALGLQERND